MGNSRIRNYSWLIGLVFVISLTLFIHPEIRVHAHESEDPDPAKSLSFEHLTTDDGLSFPNVYNILQDQQGFMWFGTKYGLNKFDGADITVYTHDPGRYPRL